MIAVKAGRKKSRGQEGYQTIASPAQEGRGAEIGCREGDAYDGRIGDVAVGEDKDGNPRINVALCAGCGLCQQVCPAGAIISSGVKRHEQQWRGYEEGREDREVEYRGDLRPPIFGGWWGKGAGIVPNALNFERLQ